MPLTTSRKWSDSFFLFFIVRPTCLSSVILSWPGLENAWGPSATWTVRSAKAFAGRTAVCSQPGRRKVQVCGLFTTSYYCSITEKRNSRTKSFGTVVNLWALVGGINPPNPTIVFCFCFCLGFGERSASVSSKGTLFCFLVPSKLNC